MVQSENFEYLNFIDFTSLGYWDFNSHFSLSQSNHNFPLIKLKEVLVHRQQFITIDDEKEYKRCKVQLRSKGVIVRDIVKGSQLKTKKQQLCRKGEVLVAEIDAKFGGYGIVPEELNDAIVSSHYFLYEIDESKIDKKFLEIYFKTDEFFKQVKATGSTNYAAIRPYHFLEYEIPLPTLPEQNKIYSTYKELKDKEVSIVQSIKNNLFQLQKYLQKELKFNDINLEVRKGLQLIDLIGINRWGVGYLLNNTSDLFQSKQNNLVSLSELVVINPFTDFSQLKKDTTISFIPMENVSDEFGEITKQNSGKVSQAKGYTRFKDGDLIWAKITPCMENGKSAVATNLINGYAYGSTEFHVLRNKSSNLNIFYLHILLRLKHLLTAAKNYFTGSAGQQRVPSQFFYDLTIPLPPLNKQLEIVDHFNRIKKEIVGLKHSSENYKIQALQSFKKELFN